MRKIVWLLAVEHNQKGKTSATWQKEEKAWERMDGPDGPRANIVRQLG